MSSLPDFRSPDRLQSLRNLFEVYALQTSRVAAHASIPGSYWGEPEAGLVGDSLFVRDDTPVHSALHEACHFICMTPQRRSVLDTDAGGDIPEENAVCYLQGILADRLAGYSRAQLFDDMDSWGYTFRLGSARAWFENDAADARDWLARNGLLDASGQPTFSLRE